MRFPQNIILSHESALWFWREWSKANPLSRHMFHFRTTSTSNGFPFRRFPTVSEVNTGEWEAVSRAAADTVLPESLRELRALSMSFAETSVLTGSNKTLEEECIGATGKEPLHLLRERCPGAKSTDLIALHHSSLIYPRASFVRVSRRVYVSSPELTFVQMATTLPFGSLVALGFELCGGYSVTSGQPGLVRHPLTSPRRLANYARQLQQGRSVKKARGAARFVLAKSASPMESEVAVLISASRHRGGFGLKPPLMNASVPLAGAAARIARRESLTVDLMWRNRLIALEYDGNEAHEASQSIDSRRRDALAAQGIRMRTITGAQLSNVFEFQELVLQLFREAGERVTRLSPLQLQAHMQLRHELRAFRSFAVTRPSLLRLL